jgi:hypothetical protein
MAGGGAADWGGFGGGFSWLVGRYILILDPPWIYGHILFIKLCIYF